MGMLPEDWGGLPGGRGAATFPPQREAGSLRGPYTPVSLAGGPVGLGAGVDGGAPSGSG